MRRISLDLLVLDFQDANCLMEEIVQQKMHEITSGHQIEPIIVRFDGDFYILRDGFHRVEAARRCGVSDLEAEVLPGTLADMEGEFSKALEKIRVEIRVVRHQRPLRRSGVFKRRLM